MTLCQFTFFLKRKIDIDEKKALFVTISNSMEPGAKTMGELYSEIKIMIIFYI